MYRVAHSSDEPIARHTTQLETVPEQLYQMVIINMSGIL